MKTLLFLLILISFTAFLDCKKEETKKSTTPTGWIIAGSVPKDYKIGIDNQNAQQGHKSGYIQSIKDTIVGFGTMMQSCNGKNFQGGRVK